MSSHILECLVKPDALKMQQDTKNIQQDKLIYD